RLLDGSIGWRAGLRAAGFLSLTSWGVCCNSELEGGVAVVGRKEAFNPLLRGASPATSAAVNSGASVTTFQSPTSRGVCCNWADRTITRYVRMRFNPLLRGASAATAGTHQGRGGGG